MIQFRHFLIFLWTAISIFSVRAAEDESVTYYVQLVWGTNWPKPDPADFRLVGPRLHRQLSNVFRWNEYWEVNCKTINVQQGRVAKLRLSKDCEIEIEFTSPTVRETRIYGKGIMVTKSLRKIRSKGLSIHGGAIEEGGSWFVVIREDKPTYQ